MAQKYQNTYGRLKITRLIIKKLGNNPPYWKSQKPTKHLQYLNTRKGRDCQSRQKG